MTGAADDLRTATAAAWRDLRSAITRAGDLDRPTSAGWSLKEMVSHVAFWMETVPPFVNGAYRGDPDAFQVSFPSGYVPGDGDWPHADVHNAREAAWARTRPAEAVLARADEAYERLEAFLATVTDEEAEAQRGYFAEIAGHFHQHRVDELGGERPAPGTPAGS